jgi:hypothetical protein
VTHVTEPAGKAADQAGRRDTVRRGHQR